MARRVAVIGAGPVGLAAARHFTVAGSTFDCQVFEQDGDLGGTWRISEYIGTDPRGMPVHSSMYHNLKTNLPKNVMCFPDFPFGEEQDTYLTQEEVLQYVEKYAEKFDLRKYIKFNHCVLEVKPLIDGKDANEDPTWELEIKNLETGACERKMFDAVVIANGHYSDPYIPKFDGMEIYKGKIWHSHDYRSGDRFANQTVLVVGGSFSALDIVGQVSQHASKVIFSHHLKTLKVTLDDNVTEVPDISRFDTNEVHFNDGRHFELDAIIFCTGYNYKFPFLTPECKITTSGYGVEPLYKHFMHIEYPTMCFLALANHVSPMQLADLEVRFFIKFLEGELILPTKEKKYEELGKDQKMRQEKLGYGPRHAHKIGCLQNTHYADLAKTADIAGIDPEIAQYILKAQEDFCVVGPRK